jgi:hypothetical protein
LSIKKYNENHENLTKNKQEKERIKEGNRFKE